MMLSLVVKISDEEVHFLFGMAPKQGAEHILKNFDVNFACTSAALSTTKPGGISSVPARSDVEKLL